MRYLFLLCAILPSIIFAQIQLEYTKQANPRKLTEDQAKKAKENYQKYCVLCHGGNREGYANDHAPSLRSKSLFESGTPHSIIRPLSYGRENTAMAGYLDEIGGPLPLDEIWNLTYWLFWQSKADRIKLSEDPVEGDILVGGTLYQKQCAVCHGKQGEGVNAPALWNSSFLAHNKDEFIRYAIRHGRENTPMKSFSEKLSSQDIDNITAFLRSKASYNAYGRPVVKQIPTPDKYILNINGNIPNFKLRDKKYITSHTLYEALKEKKRLVLLDTRVPSVWQRAHIQGSIPIPYYANVHSIIEHVPKDTQIVAYCSCPRAASDFFIKKLNKVGYERTAVLWEGIFGWIKLGYPVIRGEIEKDKLKNSVIDAQNEKKQFINEQCYSNCINNIQRAVKNMLNLNKISKENN